MYRVIAAVGLDIPVVCRCADVTPGGLSGVGENDAAL